MEIDDHICFLIFIFLVHVLLIVPIIASMFLFQIRPQMLGWDALMF